MRTYLKMFMVTHGGGQMPAGFYIIVDDRRWLKEEFQCHDLICGWSVFVGKTSKKKGGTYHLVI